MSSPNDPGDSPRLTEVPADRTEKVLRGPVGKVDVDGRPDRSSDRCLRVLALPLGRYGLGTEKRRLRGRPAPEGTEVHTPSIEHRGATVPSPAGPRLVTPPRPLLLPSPVRRGGPYGDSPLQSTPPLRDKSPPLRGRTTTETHQYSRYFKDRNFLPFHTYFLPLFEMDNKVASLFCQG